MRFAQIHGTIERRLLVNFRSDPEIVKKLLPTKFRPQIVKGQAMVGICLIRLGSVRPRFIPRALGLSSENAAHRIAVEWDSPEGPQVGVYVHRRDTSSYLSSLLGGRIFPGVHHRAKFEVRESDSEYYVSYRSSDGDTEVLVHGVPDRQLPESSVFESVEQASEFFRLGSLGYSPGLKAHQHQGLQLITEKWEVQPFTIQEVHSSFFSDKEKFPDGSIAFDNALLMLNLKHSWKVLKDL